MMLGEGLLIIISLLCVSLGLSCPPPHTHTHTSPPFRPDALPEIGLTRTYGEVYRLRSGSTCIITLLRNIPSDDTAQSTRFVSVTGTRREMGWGVGRGWVAGGGVMTARQWGGDGVGLGSWWVRYDSQAVGGTASRRTTISYRPPAQKMETYISSLFSKKLINLIPFELLMLG